MICVNCKYEHDENFCPQCGEKAGVPPVTFGSVFNDALSTITNMDKGFFFNVKSLLFSPKITIKDYIKGKRKSIYNPISFLLIAITIYLITDNLFIEKSQVNKVDSKVYSVGYEAGRFMKLYFKYFWVLSIVWLSFSTKLFFGKYNFAEHLAINSFVVGQSTLVGLIAFLLFKVDLLFNPLIYLSMFWLIYKLFEDKEKKWEVFIKSVGAIWLFFFQLILIVVLIGVIRSW